MSLLLSRPASSGRYAAGPRALPALVIAVLSLEGCSSSSSQPLLDAAPPDAAAAWAGTYACTVTLDTTFPGEPSNASQVTQDLVVTANAGTISGMLEEVDSGLFPLGAGCSQIVATVQGTTAVLLPSTEDAGPAICLLKDPDAHSDAGCWDHPPYLELAFTSGTLSLEGGALSATMPYEAYSDIAYIACDGGPMMAEGLDSGIVGSGTARMICTKN